MNIPDIEHVETRSTAVIRASVPVAEIVGFFDGAFGELAAVLAEQGITPSGPAFSRYDRPPAETFDLEVGFPTDTAIEPTGRVVNGSLPEGRVARLIHEGSFDGLTDSWERLHHWIAGTGHTPTSTFWEVYLTEPSPEMDPADLRTELNVLLA